ncbi:hypothetical protein GYA93_13110 [Gordonia desulfuricans]|uniref:Uncharacterized protein n=1 Tax=Gordonia desulfuricans TaxID=89051 RepID=A0A7K3LQN6_9ACTN|nr:hypothetical protein [Gordonia desulfuricans]
MHGTARWCRSTPTAGSCGSPDRAATACSHRVWRPRAC